jgi:thiol-disulfide isomerase/thioredoxin
MSRLRLAAFIFLLIAGTIHCTSTEPAAEWTEVLRKELGPAPGYGASGSDVGWTIIYEKEGDRFAVYASRLAPIDREAEDARLVFLTADGTRHVATCLASSGSQCSDTTMVVSGLYVNPEGCKREDIQAVIIEQLSTEGLEKVLAERAAHEKAVEAARQECPLPMPVVGKPFPFDITSIDGEELTSDGLRGKVVVLDFWATWCGPCRAEIPALKALYEKHEKDGLMVVGISYDDDTEMLRKGIVEHGIPWPQVLVGDQAKREGMSRQLGIRGIPVYFVIDRSGVLRTTEGRGALEDLVPELLGEKEPS